MATQTDTPPPQSGVPRFRSDIQGLRAIAVLVVVIFHSGLALPGGFVGVDVFFVVSGFVITTMLVRERDRSGMVRMRDFYLRRIRRLLPALAVLVAVVLALNPIFGPSGNGPITRRTGIAGVLFSSNIFLARSDGGYFDLSAEQNPLLHLWTLSVEEQFYLVFPWFLILAWRLARRSGSPHDHRLVIALVAAVAAFSFGLNLVLIFLASTSQASQLAFFSSPTRAWEFAAGALLASSAVSRGLKGRYSDLVGGLGAILLGWSIMTFNATTPFPGVAALVPVVGTILLLVAGADATSTTHRLLSGSGGRWLGDRSYSWYLWHWPLIVFAAALFPHSRWAGGVAAVLALAPAALSFRWIENPIRHSARGGAARTLALGALCIVVPIAVAVGSIPIQRVLGEPTAAAVDSHVDVYSGCMGLGSSDEPERPQMSLQSVGQTSTVISMAPSGNCRWVPTGQHDSSAGGSVFLVGDSNAGHLSEGMLDAAAGLSASTTIRTYGGCMFADLWYQRDDLEFDLDEHECRRFYEQQMARIRLERPDAVAISNATDLYLSIDGFSVGASADGPLTNDQAEKRELLEQGLRRTVAELVDLGVEVLLVHPVPKFESSERFGVTNLWRVDECSTVLLRFAPERCGRSEALASMLARREQAVAVEMSAVQGIEGATAVDPAAPLCPSLRCEAYSDAEWKWLDDRHISPVASLTLTDVLERALRPLLPSSGS